MIHSIDYDAALEALIPLLNHNLMMLTCRNRAPAIRALENDYLVLNGLALSLALKIDSVSLSADFDIDLIRLRKIHFLHDLCKRVRRSKAS